MQKHDVPRDHLLGRDINGLTIAKDARLGLDKIEQLLQCIGCSPLLPESQQAAGQNDSEDDVRVGRLSKHQRQSSCDEEDEDDRAVESAP